MRIIATYGGMGKVGFEVQHQALAAMRYPQVPQIRADFLCRVGDIRRLRRLPRFSLSRGSLPRDARRREALATWFWRANHYPLTTNHLKCQALAAVRCPQIPQISADFFLLRGRYHSKTRRRDAFTLTLNLNPKRRQRLAVLQSKTATAAVGRHAVEPPAAKAHVAKASSLRVPVYVPKANLQGAWLSGYTPSHKAPLIFARLLNLGSF